MKQPKQKTPEEIFNKTVKSARFSSGDLSRLTSEFAAPPKAKLFDNLRKFELMSFGVPEEWVNDVRAADEDSLFDVITHLPQEAQEALLKLAVGETPEPPKPAPATTDPFAHPDAQRRFRVLTNTEELERALNSPWEKWAVFLHPDQRQYAEKNYAGPARVTGSAGTGKTIVALHRAVFLARSNQNAKVLLTTFSEALARSLKIKLDHLVGNEPSIAAQVHVQSIRFVGQNLYSSLFGEPKITCPARLNGHLILPLLMKPKTWVLPRLGFSVSLQAERRTEFSSRAI